MPIYKLTDELVFPPPEGASREGIVAIGGDAWPDRLLLAYAQGIFPWPSDGLPLLWFSPNPRFVLVPKDAHVSRSLAKTIRRGEYEVRVDTAFDEVMTACAQAPRPGQDGTWITDELRAGYGELHRLGYAHSIETWRGGELVGGLYGVSLGRGFFGESMFAHAPDASKVATVALLGNLRAWDFAFIDCQVRTDHLERFGARNWPRKEFLAHLREALTHETKRGPWRFDLTPAQIMGTFPFS
ncbi:MAG: leucyl/phenylalanyl-tRNA--protein transferase [Sandaracinaceae bacterium]|nr:leucyl/phenylalanyl-tRNA--protein transferase [Sandaracinaceae bacterium]